MQKFKTEIGRTPLKAEIRNLAEQANASVWIQYGETVVLVTAVMEGEKPELGFFPLTVNFEEKYYAAGEIFGSRYFKREGKPSTEATITSRLIDRAIRPRFPKKFKNETQIIVTCLSWDGENDPDVPGLIGASLALSLSDIPWKGPLGVVRMGMQNDEFITNPSYEQRKEGNLDFVLAGTEENSELVINMMEAQTNEVEEEVIMKATEKGGEFIQKTLDFQKKIIKELEVKKEEFTPGEYPELEEKVDNMTKDKLEKLIYEKEGMEKVNELKQELKDSLEEEEKEPKEVNYALDYFEEKIDQIVHKNVIENERRPDGRELNEIREISTEVGLLPRTHGSGLFCRGKTRSLSIATLGGPEDQQLLEGMETVGKKRFMHHYNFPPYSAGEAKPLRSPGRREIGHGVLAEKALAATLPDFEDFPYAIRVVSEILSSNGSTSMASISSSSLALMDAGVPLSRPTAGIAMGLMKDKNDYKILTDIQGPEDHHGDMDLKIAGTTKGVTAIQMDVKISGISEEIFEKALQKAKKARTEIIQEMKKTIEQPRPEVCSRAPTIISVKIDPEKIGQVIGSGGKTINEITEKTGAGIDIEESGTIYITAEKESEAKKAASMIKNITKEVKVGEIYEGEVKKILDFGAIVKIDGKEGLVHISEIAPHHVKKVKDEVNVGDKVAVKVIGVNKKKGEIDLSMKQVKNK